MRLCKLAVALSMALVTVGSADDTPDIDMTQMVRVFGRFATAAHACPVEPQAPGPGGLTAYAITSAHVTDLRPFDRIQPLFPLRFDTLAGTYGIAIPIGVSIETDLSWLRLTTSVEHVYPRAAEAPPVGTRVFWTEFKLKEGRVFEEQTRNAEVEMNIGGHVIFSEPPQGGASGGCLFNEQGEVVGIVQSSLAVGWMARPNTGKAVAVWGEWLPPIPSK